MARLVSVSTQWSHAGRTSLRPASKMILRMVCFSLNDPATCVCQFAYCRNGVSVSAAQAAGRTLLRVCLLVAGGSRPGQGGAVAFSVPPVFGKRRRLYCSFGHMLRRVLLLHISSYNYYNE